MSNAKKSPAAASVFASPSTLTNRESSNDGDRTTPSDSSSPCSTYSSSGMPKPFGASNPPTAPSPVETLFDRVADERYPARVATIAAQITAANDQPTVHTLFLEGVTALGATSAVFVSFVRDDGDLAACRFMLACDPAWARLYVQEGHFVHDPWLAYAAHHSEPIVASALNLLDNDHRRVIDLAARAGFVSAVLVPAHSGAGHSRISLLCLGSATPGYFEDAGLPRLRVSARMLALELHDWWLSRIRRDLIAKARITPADLVLLQHECQGHSSKKIANELHVSKSSINSRFQRMNAKLGVGNRRMAVQLAVECGLILK